MLRLITFLILYITVCVSGQNRWEWSNPPTTSNSLIAVEFITRKVGFVCGLKGLILETNDGGESWVSKVVGRDRDLYDIYFIDSSKGFITGWHGIIPTTTSSGLEWKDRFTGSIKDIYGIDYYDDTLGCLVGEAGSIITTKNGGRTYRYFVDYAHTTRKNQFNARVANDSIALVVGWNAWLIHTTNYGRLWHKRNSKGAIEYRGNPFVDKKYVWAVAEGGEIRFSADSGKYFTKQHSNIRENLNSVFFYRQFNWMECRQFRYSSLLRECRRYLERNLYNDQA